MRNNLIHSPILSCHFHRIANMSKTPHFSSNTFALRLLACALAVAAAYPLQASAQQALPAVAAGQAQVPAPVAMLMRQDANAQVAQIVVETDKNGLPADGQSAVLVSVKLLNPAGQLVRDTVLLTIETSAGRILLNQAATDSLGPQNGDQDRVTPGVQLKVERGVASFRLLAPTSPQDVLLRVTAGNQTAQGVLSFVPELRQLLAVGLIEGVISQRNLSTGAIAPARFQDGFEQEITRWSRQFNQGKANLSARTAFFLKGKILGEKLLTAAYDSDLQTRSRLQKDIQPQEFYPVYGDSASMGQDARSAERLYVRIDDQKSYLLYGDFSTGSNASIPGPHSGLQARKLGQYQRNVTGLRTHWENQQAQFNGFAIHDNLKQVIEEYQANGTSGPFAVKNNGALVNSEKVEIVVRDKHQSDRIKQVTPLNRFDDYNFEPFSGRILFKQAVPATTSEGDPQSVRISYEVEQGGEKFWVLGMDGEWRLTSNLSLAASVVDDKNPQSPYQLQSLSASLKLGPKTSVVAELAHTESTSYLANGQVFTTPSGMLGETSSQASGRAARLEFAHEGEAWQANLQWQRADQEFNNSAAGVSPGHSDVSLKLAHQATPSVKLFGEVKRSQDTTLAAKREGAQLGVQLKVTDRLSLHASLQHIKEEGEIGANSTIASNSAPLPGAANAGGFFGFGNTQSAISPVTGTSITTLAPVATNTGAVSTNKLDANTVALGVQYKATDHLSLNASLEHGVGGASQHRYELGGQYQLSERSRLYARYENQTGLASRYTLNPAEKSNAFTAGVESSYMPGGSLFTEYRLRDALSTESANTRDLQLASGLRNTWNLAEGVAANTNLEYLHVFGGTQQKGVALATGLDYSANPLWKASAKLEFRRLFDSQTEVGNQSQDQWLSTLSVARKLDRDWTILARNYLLLTRNQDNASGIAIGNSLQERAQLGFAWRPVDNNRVNGLARYEFKKVRDDAQIEGEHYRAHILSAHLDYHPSRPWWMTTRAATKRSTEYRLPIAQQKYSASLLSGRVVYDITENWDIGVLAAWLYSPQSGSQFARGVEIGYLLKENLWLSLGYNQSGFRERDLSNADYTAKGVYLRLRFKFDETLFKANDASVNRSLPR